jgi:hypothetical protein
MVLARMKVDFLKWASSRCKRGEISDELYDIAVASHKYSAVKSMSFVRVYAYVSSYALKYKDRKIDLNPCLLTSWSTVHRLSEWAERKDDGLNKVFNYPSWAALDKMLIFLVTSLCFRGSEWLSGGMKERQKQAFLM